MMRFLLLAGTFSTHPFANSGSQRQVKKYQYPNTVPRDKNEIATFSISFFDFNFMWQSGDHIFLQLDTNRLTFLCHRRKRIYSLNEPTPRKYLFQVTPLRNARGPALQGEVI